MEITQAQSNLMTTKNLILKKEIIPVLNIAMYLNGINFIRFLEIENTSETDVEKIKLTIETDIPCLEKFDYELEHITAGSRIAIPLDKIKINRDFLNSISENEKAQLKIQLFLQDQLVHIEEEIIQVHSLDYFSGMNVFPELLATYATPNHSYVYHIKRKALEILEQNGHRTAFGGYQHDDIEIVLQVMSAIYTAIQNEEIAYSALPPGYENTGQRLRLLNTIQTERFGNCIDLSLLFAACLEACDLHPIIVITQGHAFVGCWLISDTFPEIINDDKTAITKRIALGIREIAVVEATSVCKGNKISFSDALNHGESNLVGKKDFILAIDIRRARAERYRPLPLQVENSVLQLDQELEKEKITTEMESDFEIGIIYQDTIGTHRARTKQEIWQRKLLDLSLRNNLLNIRMTRNMLQLADTDIGYMEDTLADGKSFSILPDSSANILRKYNLFVDLNHRSSARYELTNEELKNNRLLTYYHQSDLDNILNHIHKSAKTAIEENGSSTLYLAAGLLKWYDKKSPNKVRFAPILLIPVEITRRSVNSRFTLKSREEETMLNITLVEFLRQEYEMNLTSLEELPADEKGVDVAKVMGVFRRAIMQLKGWDVEEQLILGNFSFSKLILWKDIVVHEKELMKSATVRSLVEGQLNEELLDQQDVSFNPEYLKPSSVSLPIPADVSQLDAILTAQRGGSFILHGPPGTGKSQTITNIIADALYHDKKVLFVAAKKAALDVVYNRLEQIGLAPFSLELHSNKSKKSDVLSQLSRTLETAKKVRNFDFNKEAERLQNAKNEINPYVAVLHKKQPIGWSLYESIANRETYLEYEFQRIFIPNAELIDNTLFQKQVDWLPQFEAIIQLIIPPNKNVFNNFKVERYSEVFSEDLSLQTQDLLQVVSALRSQTEKLQEALDFPLETLSIEHWRKWQNAVELLQHLPETQLDLLVYLSARENRLAVVDWLDHFEKQQKEYRQIVDKFDAAILQTNFSAQFLKWKQAEQSWFLPKWLKKNKIKKQLSVFSVEKIKDDTVVSMFFESHRNFTEQSDILNQDRFNGISSQLKSLFKGYDTDLFQIKIRTEPIFQMAENLDAIQRNLLAVWVKNWKSKNNEYTSDVIRPNSSIIENFITGAQEFDSNVEQYQQLTAFQWEITPEQNWMDFYVQGLEKVQEQLPGLRDWFNYIHLKKQGLDLELDWLIDSYEKAIFQVQNLIPFFHYSINSSVAQSVISQNENLTLFNTSIFESKVNHYKNIAANFQTITRQELYLKLSANLPNTNIEAMQTSEIGILQRAIRSRGRGVSIRRLFDQIPNLLPRLVPCMLMSPISAAQYFDVNTDHFDLVIFDEASQLPTCEAISALARAKQAIIVGDPKQMPPTSFFTSNKIDEHNLDVEDLESILDDCLSLSIPSKYLLRHYRSKHESLIAFSNANYYENKLLTFPSADDLNRKVMYHHIEGYYDKGKTRQNKFEADAIVRYIEEHYSDPEKRDKSIGVVTFSQAQQNLIEDKVQELFSRNAKIEQFIIESSEPIFIKNLENVQGDERDIILFSICYGPDEEGKVSMNFGPLNRSGGWRRLNVAITRARYEMHLFATLKSDQIDLNRTASEGVAGLRGFLQFAERGTLSMPPEIISENFSKISLAKSIAKELKKRGLIVKNNIGTSDYKMDIGIVHPDQPNHYILGILTDGNHYYEAQTSNDREMVMPSVLQGLGWNIYRIWTLDWMQNKDKIVQEIVDLTEKIKNEEPIIIESPIVMEIPELAEYISEDNPSTTAQREYIATYLNTVPNASSDTIYDLHHRNSIKNQIKEIIEAEAPISKNYLFRKVLQQWQISRIGSRLDRLLSGIISELEIHSTHYNQPFYWQEKNQVQTLDYYRSNAIEKRTLEDVAPEEIWVAIQEVLEHNVSSDEDDLVRYLARLYGFTKTGRQIDSHLRLVIDAAITEKLLVRENERVRLLR